MERTGLEIAVIGMAGRFPGAGAIDAFWENLVNGVESVAFLEDEQLLATGVERELLSRPEFVKTPGGVLENADCFDAAFFGYTPPEARLMSPQTRLFHQCAWEAMEDAGYVPDQCAGAVGLYAGAYTTTYWETATLGSEGGDLMAAYYLNNRDFLATLVSYKLNLHGPAIVVNTACSTSLVAIHLACQALLAGDCALALAGGVTIRFPLEAGYLFQEGMIASPDGHTRAFDAAAGGTVGGDGIGVVVLKRLEDAQEDRDHIYALVIGSAINNDGARKVGFTAPSVEGQAAVIQKALRLAEATPASIGYIECHGTATPLGDSVEVEALKLAFGRSALNSCALGSAKTNLGHLDIAAGAAGFIKAVLCLEKRRIPPSLFFNTPNPQIDFADSPFYVNGALSDWKQGPSPRRAGVSSFGVGGTNAHLILEEYDEPFAEEFSHRSQRLLLLSARTETALRQAIERLADHLDNHPALPLADAAYTLQTGRRRFRFRAKAVCAHRDDALSRLRSDSGREIQLFDRGAEAKPPRVVFLFSGLGRQFPDMGRELYLGEPVFRREMDRCFALLAGHGGPDLKAIMYPVAGSDGPDDGRLRRFDIAQLAVFVYEYSLARLLAAWGIEPAAMMGYSFGEFTAACLAEVFSLDDALRILALRGRLIRRLPGGAMLSVPLPAAEVEAMLPQGLALAIDNGPSCVVSGPLELAQEFGLLMKERKLLCVPLESSHALHSSMMEPVMKAFGDALVGMTLTQPRIPYISTVTGDWIRPQDAVSTDYWGRQMRETVRFSDGLDRLLAGEDTVFLEIGPGRDLYALAARAVETGSRHRAIAMGAPPQTRGKDAAYLLDKIGLLWCYGVSIDWEAYYKEEPRRRVPLPAYPFEAQRFAVDFDSHRATGLAKTPGLPQERELADSFYIPYWKQEPSLPDRAAVEAEDSWLLFVNRDEDGSIRRFDRELVAALRSRGRKVAMVVCGESYSARTEQGLIQLNPACKDDYDSLVRDLSMEDDNRFPTRVVHLWGAGEPDARLRTGGRAAFDLWLDYGYYSLLYFAQALVARGIGQKAVDLDDQSLRLVIQMVVSGLFAISGEEVLCPEKSPVMGLCKTIPQEYPNLVCRVCDVQVPSMQASSKDRLVQRLIKEWSLDSGSPATAYRGTIRYVEDYRLLRLDATDDALLLRRQGVYLITGGLGNDSFARAKYLAGAVGARLVLTGRTPLPDRQYWSQYRMLHGDNDPVSVKIQRILELEALGAEVEVMVADVADELEMRMVMRQIERRFGGRLDGVVHAAGVTDIQSSRLVMDVGRDESEWHFRPKVYGLFVLEKLLRGRDLDFCLLTSSIASVIAGIGLSAYTASSVFLDAFAQRMNIEDGSFPWIVLNWLGAPADETVEAFRRVLSRPGIERLVYCPTDLGKLIRQRVTSPQFNHEDGVAADHGAGSSLQRPELANPFVAPRNPLEERLATIWQRFFGIESIGVCDDIFDLGGDSLKAINILAIVQKELKVQIPVNVFFQDPTISGLAAFLEREPRSGGYSDVTPAEEKEYYRLSSAQQRMFLFQRMTPESVAYNSPVVESLEGELDIRRLQDALTAMVRRHESLRTAIVLRDGEPFQRIYPPDEAPFQLEILSAEDGVDDLVRRFVRPFDLFSPPLFRVGLATLGKGRFILLEDMHHIITDAVSIDLFEREFMTLYSGGELPPLPLQYKDYSEWQHSPPRQEAILQQQEYWLRQFEQELPELELPLDFPRPAARHYDGRRLHFQLEAADTGPLKTLASQNGATLFMTLLAILSLLLSKLSGNRDIVVGTPVAGRGHADLESIIGIFINTLALRIPAPGQQTIEAFIGHIKERTLDAFANQDYPFETLVEKTGFDRAAGRHPLFDVFFLFQDAPQNRNDFGEKRMGEGLTISPIPYEVTSSKFDLTFILVTQGEELLGSVEYCSALFNEETILRFIACFRQTAAAVAARQDLSLDEVGIVSPEEKLRILHRFNDTAADEPELPSLHAVFHAQAQRTPDRTALVDDGDGPMLFTYGCVRSNVLRLAQRLIRAGAVEGSVVPIMTERSAGMVMGTLAILTAGCAYLPVDPSFPRRRVEYILADCDAAIMMMGEGADADVRRRPRIVTVKSEPPAGDDALFTPGAGGSMAYVIYTSGSTGHPKGVMVEHRSAVNILWDLQRRFPLEAGDAYLLKTSFVFDVSVTELFGWCWCGGRLAILPENGEKDPAAIARFIDRHGVTHVNFVPSMFNVFVDWLEAGDSGCRLACLQHVFLAGEALRPELARRFLQLGLLASLENIYGPTEGTIYAIRYSLDDGWDRQGRIPIGAPMANCGALVLDPAGHIQPIGVPGELCLFGRGLARGYMNRPQLTIERFLPSHRDIPGPIYRTGDRARWLPEGHIEYLGRLDQQIKIRGFRVELGEIESCLLEHPAVRDAAALALDAPSGELTLAAFITGSSPDDLEDHLKKRLPAYMIPARIILLEELPLNPSGKLDRKALPALDAGAEQREFQPPQTKTERMLASIWAKVLAIPEETIGVNDNFFQLGGHSLKAALAATRIQQALRVALPPAQLFDTPTVHSLARRVETLSPHVRPSLHPVEKREYYPLSPAQQRLFVLQQMDPANTAYNMPEVFLIGGEAHLDALEQAFIALVARHESFRTSFFYAGGIPMQRILPEVPLRIEESDLGSFIRPFDLACAPLLRVGTGNSPEGETLLLMDMHHIIGDGLSAAVILHDLASLYDGSDPGSLTVHYKEFVLWQQLFLRSDELLQSQSYWLERFSDGLPVLHLPIDGARPPVFDGRGDSFTAALPEAAFAALQRLAAQYRATMFQVLLALYFVFLAKISGQEDIVVGTPVSGRTHPDVRPMVGMFVNTLALRATPKGETSLDEFLLEVKLLAGDGVRHQDVQFEYLVERLAVQRDPGRNPVFDAMFVLQEEQPEFQYARDLGLSPYPMRNPFVKCDLAFVVTRDGRDAHLRIEYATALFAPGTIKRFAAYFEVLVASAAKDHSLPIAAIGIIPDDEKNLMLRTFNDTACDFPRDETLHRLALRQARQTPDAVAVQEAWSGDSWTYRRLEEEARALASRLRAGGARPREIVAVAMEPSLAMAAGMLAVMMVGCAYLPIEPGAPSRRISVILEDSAARWMLTCDEPQAGIAIIPIAGSAVFEEKIEGPFEPDPAGPGDAAYIIYTSGSTGVPKGVMIGHRAIVNMLWWAKHHYQIVPGDAVLQLSSIVFDASVEAIFTPLIAGARLVLVKPEHRLDTGQLRAMLATIPVTHFSIVPSLYEHYIDGLCRHLPHLRSVTVCGERCGRDLIERHFDHLGHVRLFNGYGPSENSVCSTIFRFDPASPEVLIGRPIANVACYVLDKYGNPAPLGTAGELCVAGSGLARGYVNRPELTAQLFAYHSPGIPYRLYKTGDLARYRPDGNLEFLGRIDRQVKIRGFRVELEEIELQLMKHPLVAAAAVIVRDIPSPEIWAFITAKDEAAIDDGSVRAFLEDALPHYMVPVGIVALEEMPLTPSGKIDRQRLPGIEPQEQIRRATFVEPKTELETLVAGIWREVLGVESVGLRDNFFVAGGNSLKVMELASKLSSSLDRPVPVVELFKHQTIAAFVGSLDSTGPVPLAPENDERRLLQDRARDRRDIQKNRRRSS